MAGGLNLYGYAGGDPVNFSDPFGLCADDGGGDGADQGDQGDQGGDSTKAKAKPKPQPKKPSCQYQVSTGHMTCQENGQGWNVVDAYGYSGAPGGYKNNWAMTSVRNKGPIPVGTYRIEAPFPGKHNGMANVMRLTCINSAFVRTDLEIHGDSRTAPGTASQGCIAIDPETRAKIGSAGGGTLNVVP